MGCSSSKNAVVPSVGQAWTAGNKPTSAGSTKSKSSSKLIRVKSGTTEVKELKPERTLSRDSLQNGVITRGVSSATSKASAHTCDSGLEEDYGHIISEESNPTEQEGVLTGQRPRTPDLSISGTQISSRKRSGKDRENRTGKDIIGELKSQGLLSRPVAAQSGMAFDVMIAPEFGILQKPPPRLAKLKKRKSKKRTLTREELEAKLKSAEERRKRKEAEKIEKLNTAAKEKQVQECLDASEAAQKKEVSVKSASDMDRVAENKEARLKAMKEKLEKKKQHAERVRLARLARQAEGGPSQETDMQQSKDDVTGNGTPAV
ncbi:uncharacterized protein [Asterias amurensis]|uniref:uncharacterized protein n=1 Tax=Asterias amurensis TaxID=7602 RepID=UPI003AB38C43